jgi:hypothetical protein
MKKITFKLFVLFLTILQVACTDYEGGTSKSMQEDFDKIRLDHILIINDIVNEYKEKTGHFPLENYSEKPVYVKIATKEQIDNDKGRSNVFLDLSSRAVDGKIPDQPKSISEVTLKEFTSVLEKGLQRTIKIPVDPQKVPVNKPSLYYYTYYLGVFDVTAFLHNDFTFARKIGQFYNKITVGCRSYPQSAIWTPNDLMVQEEFRQFFQSKFNKSGYTIKTRLNYKAKML